ncbi:MAG TPA: NAD-dependent succinate-semialdehyde dehydrogenase [Candidatus Methylacidiphilales bacterium]
MNVEKNLIAGKWQDTTEWIEVYNPADGSLIGKVPNASAADAHAALDAASQAFPAWSRLNPFKRTAYLRKAAEIVSSEQDQIARLLTMEQGKPLSEALGEVKKGAEILRFYAEEGERVHGTIIPNADVGVESRVIYEPLGVAVAISPWNYPIELLAWKLGGALAAGCTVVCKLPEETPFSPITFVRCVEKSGLPAGVVNCLTGPGPVLGPPLVTSPISKKIAFTGSTAVGRKIMHYVAESGSFKKLSLELGGNKPMIVCADCDLALAVKGAVRRSFRNMGQICIAINRIYIEEPIYERFLELFAAETQKLKIGNGLTDDCDLGPMCTARGIATVERHLADAVKKGARLVCGGRKPEGAAYEKGHYYLPTILRDVNHEMLVMREESFGPIVGVMSYKTLDEAIDRANDSPYGLAAVIYTDSLSAMKKAAHRIEAGNIAINTVDSGVINAPYGGFKDSGIGYEHAREGLYEYLRMKHIRVNTGA